MLRYQLGNRNGNTESRKGILSLKEAAALAHISEGRAKRIKQDAFDFLKKHIEKNEERKTFQPPELSLDARLSVEKLREVFRDQATHNTLIVRNIPFLACSVNHPETITGMADLTVATMIPPIGEQVKTSAYVPTWIISGESKDNLTVRLRFPVHDTHAAEATLHLHVDMVDRDCGASDGIKNAPNLTEWLWCLACELWMTDETETESRHALSAQHAFIRDVCDAILEHHRRLGG